MFTAATPRKYSCFPGYPPVKERMFGMRAVVPPA